MISGNFARSNKPGRRSQRSSGDRWPRQWRRWRRWLLPAMIGLVVLVAAWWASSSDFLTIRQTKTEVLVRVSGDAVNRQRVASMVDSWRGSWIWSDTSRLESSILSAQPAVGMVAVEVDFPDTLVVGIVPRVPWCQLVSDQGVYLIDRGGMVFAQVDEPVESIPTLRAQTNPQVGKQISASGVVLGLAVISSLRGYPQAEFEQAVMADGQLTFSLQRPATIVMKDDAKPSHVVPELAAMMKRFAADNKYPVEVDMRFNRPVLRW